MKKAIPGLRALRAQEDLPLWATLERRLIDVMDDSTDLVMQKYVRNDGTMLWPTAPDFQSIDALDDMYESFHNWPLYYLLGGDEKFLELSHFEYDAITRQFAGYDCGHGHPMVVEEYEQGYDWMHQGEGYLFFYLLNLADPGNPKNRERALRYASFYTGEKTDNYDPEKKMMRCCYLGSMGAAHRNFDGKPWGYAEWKQYYGLPFYDVEGIKTVEDIKDPEKALKMAEVMKARLSHSDTLVNMLSTSMVMNAYLHTGDEKYKRWIDEYVGAWRARTEENGGIVPDNVGPDGKVGGAMGGKWYGGYYGWTWPHGFYFIADALTVAGQNQCLLSGDPARVNWLGEQVEKLMEQGLEKDGTLLLPMKRADEGAHQEYYNVGERFLSMPGKVTDREDFTRLYEKGGWYEFTAMPAVHLAHAYSLTRDPKYLQLARALRNHKNPNWDRIQSFYSKDQGGHEAAWLSYLCGEYPEYPEQILNHAIKQVYGRLKFMREDDEEPAKYTDSYLQRRNPVNVEALVQLTTGGLPPIYNGGLLLTSIRYFDSARKRPGLPRDVAALVSSLTEDGLTVTLVNISPSQTREFVLGAGAFGEHEFMRAEFFEPGGDRDSIEIGGRWLSVSLAPASVVTVEMTMRRFALKPRYYVPWEE